MQKNKGKRYAIPFLMQNKHILANTFCVFYILANILLYDMMYLTNETANQKEENEMQKFEIYCNYGVLGSEKRNIYTYGHEHIYATCSDKLTVVLPENDVFSIYKNVMGELMVESSWGWQYGINEVLQGKENPCFYAIDSDKNGHRVQLEIVEE